MHHFIENFMQQAFQTFENIILAKIFMYTAHVPLLHNIQQQILIRVTGITYFVLC